MRGEPELCRGGLGRSTQGWEWAHGDALGGERRRKVGEGDRLRAGAADRACGPEQAERSEPTDGRARAGMAGGHLLGSSPRSMSSLFRNLIMWKRFLSVL